MPQSIYPPDQAQVEDQEKLLKAHEHFVKSEAASLLEPVDRNRDSLIEEWRPVKFAKLRVGQNLGGFGFSPFCCHFG